MTESILSAHLLKSCKVWQGVVALHPKLISAKSVRMKAVRISLAFSQIRPSPFFFRLTSNVFPKKKINK